MGKEWLAMYVANYKGETNEAQELQGLLKQNYKGNNYIPWATLERMIYLQDPEVEFSEPVFYQESYDIYTKDGEKEISVNAVANMVKLEVIFLGKKFQEFYPIQDSSYDAPKVIDANLLNKAIQRAKTRLIAKATGLGWKLYEDGDLQYEDDKKKKPTKPKKVEIKPVATTKTETVAVQNVHTELAKDIHKNVKLEKGLQALNPSLVKKYQFTISIEEPIEKIAEKLSKLDNAEKFVEAIKKKSA